MLAARVQQSFFLAFLSEVGFTSHLTVFELYCSATSVAKCCGKKESG